MPLPDAERLRAIKSFPSLVKYLRDDLEWPIESDDFEELTYEYEPEELGLDPKSAVKVKEIKQLRPLVTGQPWGIFFINFEPKRLPVVVLRRILRALVVKKRQSANKSHQAVWKLHDLLFISSYGESDHRDLTFAHFSEDSSAFASAMPTLRVLGWDDEDTILHLDHAHRTLKDKLRWPNDEKNVKAWRDHWSSAFTIRQGEVIRTSKDLAVRMAKLASNIRCRVNDLLMAESAKGPWRKLMSAFREALIHDLTEDDFADMYAQTITYGLLTARMSRYGGEGEPGNLVADDITEMVPITNPFLRDLLASFLTVGGRRRGIDFDEAGIGHVLSVLCDPKTNMGAVLRDFGDRNPQEDPVIHFYELFLKEYDPKKRMQRGVFYTPRPVVSYIVRSVHELLQTEFGLEDGLAATVTWGEMAKKHKGLKLPVLKPKDPDDPKSIDELLPADTPFVQILDPATGTATFLVEVIDLIHKTMVAKWKKQGHTEMFDIPKLWNEYVPQHLLPRLYGFELMMAPYAIAHMKIGLKLHEAGYRFGSDERARVYMTNSLEPAHEFPEHFNFDAPALAHEAQAVNAVKRLQRFTVVIGNPPYSNFGQLNKIPLILDLLEDYKRALDEKKVNLDDDFIKFIRFSQHVLDKTGVGVFGMITNNVFIDGITHRRMRESLKASFANIRILDLHGSSKKLEDSPDGSKDENVFDIQQGVGISLFTKSASSSVSSVRHAELWGARVSKYGALAGTSACGQRWTTIECAPAHYFFVPKCFEGIEEYREQPSIAGDVFVQRNAGIQTKRDGLVYSFTKDELEAKLSDMRALIEKSLVPKYELPADGRDWAVQWARDDVRKGDGKVIKVSYHPFDLRWTYFTGRTKGFMAYPRTPLMWSALKPNRLLLTVRNPRRGNVDSFFVGSTAVDKDSVSPFDNVTFFPLYIYRDNNATQVPLGPQAEREPNFNPDFLNSLCKRLDLPTGKTHGLPDDLSSEDIFHYAYALFHSPGYRSRYAEFLKIDFPRLPLTSSLELFKALAKSGGDLVALHLLESAKLNKPITKWRGKTPSGQIEKVTYADETVCIDKARTEGFSGVPEAVWNFHIGGYQVCNKWLKDRKGRQLSTDDITHYQKIVVALHETIRLMKEIDEVIEKHGGWPGTFVAEKPKSDKPSRE